MLDDPSAEDPTAITRVILCSGKVYYDLIAHRAKIDRHEAAIVRIEQLYPFPDERIAEVLGRYDAAQGLVWVQEEPKNMGAYRFIDAMFREKLDLQVPFVGRDANATPAVASNRMHHQEQERIMITALGLPSSSKSASSRLRAVG